MSGFWVIAFVVDYVLVPFALFSVLRQRKEPMAMLSWLLAILFLPYIGMVLYWILGSNWVVRRTKRRRKRVAHLIAKIEAWADQQAGGASREEQPDLPDDLRAIAKLGRRLADLPAVGGNQVEIFQEANATFAALEAAIRQARHHIHAEYYIWRPDETGIHFRDLLIEKARAGVQVRLLLDAVGCFWITRKFTQPLLDAGARVAYFLPLRLLRRKLSPHMRNHRKIVVVDGRVAFLGSQNIGDEYRGRLRKLSPWYDTHMYVAGPAALFVQRTFAEDWLFATREDLTGEEFFPQPERPGSSIVQILPTGPTRTSVRWSRSCLRRSARPAGRSASPRRTSCPARRCAWRSRTRAAAASRWSWSCPRAATR